MRGGFSGTAAYSNLSSLVWLHNIQEHDCLEQSLAKTTYPLANELLVPSHMICVLPEPRSFLHILTAPDAANCHR